ncbi:MAG: hypothetical protein B6I25_08650 [Planctomycetales bacterium 4572_13]|nr:MAG: hypothetical protein B6I25_08650 [Planctomycetales bacterium 4572_13]
MESKRFFKNAAFALLIVGLCISNSFAGLVDGSTATATLSDRLEHVTDGWVSFAVQVDYEVYDGTDGTDPLGSNGLYQAVFKLTHLGGVDSGDTAVNMWFFTVYSGDYTSAVAVDQGGSPTPVLPNYIASKYTPEVLTDRAEYYFDDDEPDFNGTFAEGDVSQLLILTFNPADMPQENITIEADSSSYGLYGQETITLVVPEPATLLLLASGSVLLLRVRKRRSA